MIPDEQPAPAPRDHNRPPSPVEALTAEQRDALLVFMPRRDELVAAAEKKNVFDRASAGDAADIIRIAREVYERIDADRRERTAPYRQAADAAKGVADEFWQPVVDALEALRDRVKAWTDAEDARIAEQKAEQERAMDAMRQAQRPAPVVSAGGAETTPVPSARQYRQPDVRPAAKRKIRGDMGATLSTVEKFEYHVTDIKLVPDWILATPTVHAAIVQVVKSMAKHVGDIPGIERTTITDNQIR